MFPRKKGVRVMVTKSGNYFDIAQDPGETSDLAESDLEKLQELERHWDQHVFECGVVWGETAEALGVDKGTALELREDDKELQRGWMNTGAGVHILSKKQQSETFRIQRSIFRVLRESLKLPP